MRGEIKMKLSITYVKERSFKCWGEIKDGTIEIWGEISERRNFMNSGSRIFG